MDVYPLFIEQSRIDFNKGLFDSLTNAYILAYSTKTIQFNMISCGVNNDNLQHYIYCKECDSFKSSGNN